MIARIWHGITAAAKSDEYLDYLEQTGVPDYRATQGNRGVYVLRRTEGEQAHFLTVSFWESMEAIKGFAGPDPERARYYPEDEEYLLGFEPTVEHFEVLADGTRERRTKLSGPLDCCTWYEDEGAATGMGGGTRPARGAAGGRRPSGA